MRARTPAESRTFQNRVYFTTYSPEEREYNPEFCVATVGLNRLYLADAATGRLFVGTELAQGSIVVGSDFRVSDAGGRACGRTAAGLRHDTGLRRG